MRLIHDDDPQAVPRGVVYGLALSIAFWLLLGVSVYLAVRS
jgi:hypothetical protein